MFLDFVRYQVEQSDRWNFHYPKGANFDDKHAKLEIVGGEGSQDKLLQGIAMSLMIQIYEKASDIITPNVMFCGVSIKDKHRTDNIHKDHTSESERDLIKVLGVLNSDWQDYYGSSDDLTLDVNRLGKDKFTREILFYCKSKAELSYVEAREQFARKVLESNDYYNGHIRVRVHGKGILKS